MITNEVARAIRATLSDPYGTVKIDAVATPLVEVPPVAAVVEPGSAPAAVLDAVAPVEPAPPTPPKETEAVPNEGPASAAEKPLNPTALDDVSGVSDAAADYAAANIAVRSAAAIQEWVETDDLDDGETLADRLLAGMVGIADSDQDGELDDDEQAVLEASLEAGWDYLSSKGVTDDDCSLLLNDWDDAAANRIRDLVAAKLPDGDEAAARDIDNFAFGDDQAPALDAVYKKRMVIRGGQKVRINKRVSGHVRLSARQKVGIRKAQMKSHTASAMMHRAKSMRKSRSMGLTK